MDSYRGNTVRLRYFLRVTVSRGMGGMAEEFSLWVQNVCKELPPPEPIKVRRNAFHTTFGVSAACTLPCILPCSRGIPVYGAS